MKLVVGADHAGFALKEEIRGYLGQMLFSGEDALKLTSALSGGEAARLTFCRLMLQKPNVLVLDEPTNHLDIWACDALEQALKEFDGTAIVVSHDRYFLNQVADLLIVFAGPDEVQVVHGNYDTYERLRAQQLADAAVKEERRRA